MGHPPTAIDEANLQWHTPLPLSRRAFISDPDEAPAKYSITYGDYFTAAANFIYRNDMAIPVQAAAHRLRRSVACHEIDHLEIHLAKHGAFYHPALVTFRVGDAHVPLVLNVAVGSAGRAILAREYKHLKRLNHEYADAFVPQVYAYGRGTASGQRTLEMFAAQWLTGYHEVHLTAATASDRQQWQVWDPEQGNWRLSRRQTVALYRQATCILTYYFNPFTFEAVMDWHPAAGDFVIKKERDRIDVRLISVRRYAPLFQLDPQERSDLQTLLDAQVVFLLNVAMRMRMDRLDGTGALVWAHDGIVPAIWEGFCRGLRRTAGLNGLPNQWVEAVGQYFVAHTSDELYRLSREILGRYPRPPEETALVTRHLADHAALLAAVIQNRK